ncbi:hypothetical protein EDD18DRAFT_1339685 [Armillaria luteobubalina]|uniref:Uncharacterized protein n=1 Tax=Armillaria luteobubalina TaxID=153913 RepID=A0AA39NY42_9AGAR|nr:hypothetical protein EDD18DRAFT_1339685 [Armillaria luteobubalina]
MYGPLSCLLAEADRRAAAAEEEDQTGPTEDEDAKAEQDHLYTGFRVYIMMPSWSSDSSNKCLCGCLAPFQSRDIDVLKALPILGQGCYQQAP